MTSVSLSFCRAAEPHPPPPTPTAPFRLVVTAPRFCSVDPSGRPSVEKVLDRRQQSELTPPPPPRVQMIQTTDTPKQKKQDFSGVFEVTDLKVIS